MSSKFDLFLELFPHCNLNCKFCHQHEISGYKENYQKQILMPKTYYVKQCLEQLKKQNITSCSHLNIIGGELFYDKDESYVNAMKELVEYLNPSTINATSNLIFNVEDNELFSYLMNRQEFILCASYNPVNRYQNEKQLELFTRNVRKLYMPLHEKGNTLCLEVILQSEILRGEVDLPFLDYVIEVNKLFRKHLIDVTFFVDYRGYSQDVLEHFNEYLYRVLKRYPCFSEIKPHKKNDSKKGKYGGCYKPGAKCLSYNNGFKYSGKNSACIDQNIDIYAMKDRMEKYYKCNECPYESDCKGRCPITLDRAGLLTPNQPCYMRFLFDVQLEFANC